LARHTQSRVLQLYQGFAVGKPKRADLVAKKSRSTFNCPISLLL
jgi:hypothetical protein